MKASMLKYFHLPVNSDELLTWAYEHGACISGIEHLRVLARYGHEVPVPVLIERLDYSYKHLLAWTAIELGETDPRWAAPYWQWQNDEAAYLQETYLGQQVVQASDDPDSFETDILVRLDNYLNERMIGQIQLFIAFKQAFLATWASLSAEEDAANALAK